MKNSLLVSLTAMAIALAGCGGGSGSRTEEPVSEAPPVTLKAALTGEALQEHLKGGFSSLNQLDGPVSQPIAVDEAAVDSLVTGNNPAFSATNVQVAGVDEADHWKFNGKHFYYLSRASDNTSEVKVLQAGASPESLGVIPLDISADNLFVDHDNLTAISANNYFAGIGDAFVTDALWGNPYGFGDQNLALQSFDISGVEGGLEPVLATLDIEIEGVLVGTRKIGDHVYIVSRFTAAIPDWIFYPQTDADVAANALLLEQVTLADLVPTITVNGVSESLTGTGGCYTLASEVEGSGYPILSSITRIDITSGDFSNACIAAPASGLYLTASSAYLFNHTYDYSPTPNDGPVTDSTAAGTLKTHIHKVQLGDTLTYVGSGLADGSASCNVSSFCFGELADGSLALVTTLFADDIEHQLTVLAPGDLSELARLPNADQPAAIGKPGELLYAARFLQDRVYLVTFAKVDPLYVIGLSDPANPEILGELEVPGYSDYLLPIGEELLVGVGRDAALGASGITWYQGVKVDLYDVADVTSPTQLDSFVLGKRGSSTPVEYHPKALSALATEDGLRFVLPVRINAEEPQGVGFNSDPESQFYGYSYTGFQGFEVDIPGGNQAAMTLMPPAVVHQANDIDVYAPYSQYQERSTLVGDQLYYFYGGRVFIGDWSDTASVIPITE